MKKYQKGGTPKKPLMNPAKIAVGPLKPATPKEKEEALKKFKAAMEKEMKKAKFPAVPPKKKMGGYTESKTNKKKK
jgi:hypothetical protein